MQSPLLIIEDEIKIAGLLKDYCVQSGFDVEVINNGREAQEWLQHNQPRLILLDLMLPDVDGITICKDVRRNSDIPIIMITAKVEEIDRLIGLELGADDYICKPFSPREVIARIKTVLRRTENTLQKGEDALLLDDKSHSVSYKQIQIELTTIEFKLLHAMYKHPGQIFSRDQLLTHIYSDNRVVNDRTVDSHIKKLRNKLSEKLENMDVESEIIQSVYGAGYRYQQIK
ncbi:MAG: response regulator [Cocleimonas sp.]